MTNPRLLISTLVAVLLGGFAHAGEFSLGSARLLAENSTQSSVDVTVTFTDRGQALREMAEGGDPAAHNTRELRGADVATPDSSDNRASVKAPAAKPAEAASPTSDSPHGVSISPSTAIKRPSYRWQSLVPGTIK